ncbi:hypothetical protein HDU81_004073 [Chytriomyces hyalinus]|nr:hypothetical protein HDU81_004073 [Chytriomyces hyalinus]
MAKAGAPQAKRDQRKAGRMNPMQASTGQPTTIKVATKQPSTNQLPASTQGRAPDGQSSQGTVVPVSVVIQSRVHQIMASQLGLAMTPQQLLAHVYGMADSELTMLSAEQKQVLNFITHLQMVKVHSLQTQASNLPILRLNTANLNKASHTMATPLTPTNGVAAAAAASLASAPILPTSIPSPSQGVNNPISLPSCSASDLQQNPPILTSSANQAAGAQRLIPVPSHSQHSADDILHLLTNDAQSHRQFQPLHPQFQQRLSHQQTQQQIHSMPTNHNNATLRQSMSQQSLHHFSQQQQHPQHQMDPSSYQQQSHYYDQQQQQQQPQQPQQQQQQLPHQQQQQQQQAIQHQQSQSGMEHEMAQMRVQMVQMQKYISQLVQNQSQMNGQISQLFAQLMKVTTTSPLPISPPSLQTSTPVELTKSPTHDDGLAQQANVTALSLSAITNLVQNSASSQQIMNDFTFDESFVQIFNDAALELQ